MDESAARLGLDNARWTSIAIVAFAIALRSLLVRRGGPRQARGSEASAG